MNIFLWVLQIVLALWNIMGGVFTILHFEKLKGGILGNKLPKPVWMLIGALQVLFALALVLPSALSVYTELVPVAGIYLAFNSLLGCLWFTQYVGFPGLLWGVIPAVAAAIIAYGRFTV